MSYEAVLTQIKSVPEACIEDISNYIDYVVYRYEQEKIRMEKSQALNLPARCSKHCKSAETRL